MSFTFHTPETAPEAAKPLLEKAKAQNGFVPSLYAGLGNAPAVLQAYLQMAELFGKTSLSSTEQQVVWLATSVEHECTFCVAVHSMIAKKLAKVPGEFVSALRQGENPEDERLTALADFTRAVIRERGHVLDHPAYKAFLDAGFKQEQALEVILGVAHKTLSNYANHLMQTPVDAAFASEEWNPAEKKAAR
jgi:AhpD family alkylhydroperoxidase